MSLLDRIVIGVCGGAGEPHDPRRLVVVRFLVDAQLPPALARVLIRVDNTRRQPLFAWFEPLIDRVVEVIESGDGFVELR